MKTAHALPRPPLEDELWRTNRALRALSECGRAVAKASEEIELLQAVCRVIVEAGGYAFAWVGEAERNGTHTVRPLAQAGEEAGYLSGITITWDDSETGQGPTGQAIRTGRPSVAHNISTDPAFEPWRKAAKQRGFASSLALPLGSSGEPWGALMIYADRPDAFDPAETSLLEELAETLGHGVLSLRARAGRERAERVQSCIYAISEAAHNSSSQQQLYQAIHRTIAALMPARNFYIALYDPPSGLLSFPYFVDEHDSPPPPKTPGKGLTDYVLKTGKALRASPETLAQLMAAGEVEPGGTLPVDWLGVPLKLHDRVLGVLVVQSYAEGTRFGEDEKNMLVFVSEQVAMAIERQRAQEDLRKSEERFRQTLDNLMEGCMLLDREWRYLYVNDSVARQGHQTRTNLLGRTMLEMYPGVEHSEVFAAYRRCMEERIPQHFEASFQFPDGMTNWFEFSVQPVPEGIFVLTLDITERKQTEAELRKTAANLRHAQAVGHVGSWYLDVASNELSWSEESYRIFRQCPGQSLNYQAFLEIVHPEDRLRVNQAWQAALHGAEYDIEHRIGAGKEIRWVRERAEVEFDGQGRPLRATGTVHDITERKQAEEAMLASEEKYRSFFQSNLAANFVASPEGRILECNRAFLELFGFTSEAEAKRTNMACLRADPRQRERLLALLKAQGRLEGYEEEMHRMDGSPRYVRANIMGAFNAQGELQEIRSYVIDETQRRKTEEQFRQAQKMEAVGLLAGGVAHDFNNFLSVILGYTELIRESREPSDPLLDKLAAISRAAERAADLTRQLLAFSRKQVLQPRVLDLNGVVRESEKLLTRVIGEDIQLVTSLAPDLGQIMADWGQMGQVVMNLAVNSRDAMPHGGKLLLETRNVQMEEADVREHPEMRPGPYALLAVSDTGTGMDSETLSRIFEPFFTTKRKGKGTGLGLATVYGIVRQSGGHIWVYSEPDRGTTFKLYMPRVDIADAAPPEAETPSVRGGTETILVVEDDDSLRRLAAEILRAKGYTVLVASNLEEALPAVQQHGATIDLLLSDVVLPAASGPEVAKQIQALCPAIKVLYMSGYTDDAIAQHGILESGIALLEKPFTPAALCGKVRDCLDGR